MKNTSKRLAALNTDSLRGLVDTINERNIMKDDVLKLYEKEDSYFLLYYEDVD